MLVLDIVRVSLMDETSPVLQVNFVLKINTLLLHYIRGSPENGLQSRGWTLGSANNQNGHFLKASNQNAASLGMRHSDWMLSNNAAF